MLLYMNKDISGFYDCNYLTVQTKVIDYWFYVVNGPAIFLLLGE